MATGEARLMRRTAPAAVVVAAVLYAPIPLTAQTGGETSALVPVAEMPADPAAPVGAAEAPPSQPVPEAPVEVPTPEAPTEPPVAEAPAAPPVVEPPVEPLVPAPAEATVPEVPPQLVPPERIDDIAAADQPPPLEPLQAMPAQGGDVPPVDAIQDVEESDPEELEEDLEDLAPTDPDQDEAGGQDGAPAPPTPTVVAAPRLPDTGADLGALGGAGFLLLTTGLSLRLLLPARR